MTRRILVAGIGNIFLGDDGFGSEVGRRLLRREPPSGVQVVDVGIGGIDLAYLLLDDYDALILIDTVARGGAPGSLYLIAVDTSGVTSETGLQLGKQGVEGHSMDPAKVLAFARALGARPIPTYLIGCEPGPLADPQADPQADPRAGGTAEEMRMGLSAPIAAAVEPAARMAERLMRELLSAREGTRLRT